MEERARVEQPLVAVSTATMGSTVQRAAQAALATGAGPPWCSVAQSGDGENKNTDEITVSSRIKAAGCSGSGDGASAGGRSGVGERQRRERDRCEAT